MMDATRCTKTNATGDQCRFVKGHIGSHGYDKKFNKNLKSVK